MRVTKLGLLACCLATVFGTLSASAVTIATWTFETSIPTTAGPLAPEVGAGSALGFHATATVYSNPVGNGSFESWSSTAWSIGDYYQFQVDSTGLEDLAISWMQTRSSSGPSAFNLQYSTDGTTFTTFTGYTVPQVTWSSLAPEVSGTSVFSQDLSSITALNNDSSIYFRLTASGAPGGSGGTNRVDNISISGLEIPTVPEPTSFALVLVSLGGLLIRRK